MKRVAFATTYIIPVFQSIFLPLLCRYLVGNGTI